MENEKDYKKVLELMMDITICAISERGVMYMLRDNKSDELFGLDILSEAVEQYHKALEFFIKDNNIEK